MAYPLIARILLAGLACAAAGAPRAPPAGGGEGDQRVGSLRFTAIQAGAKFTGAFRRFEVRFEFDVKNPGQGRLHVIVPTASVDTADPERDQIIRSADFFWTEKYADAVFHAEGFEPDGRGFLARGELTLRGITRPATARFELKQSGKRLAMKGTAQLRRLPFGIGQGEWESTEWIGDEVGVLFDLKLRPAPAAASP
ncbi:MAG: YceI family protein [Steroidobacteraceae bacterium]